jgi:hypothetical protein
MIHSRAYPFIASVGLRILSFLGTVFLIGFVTFGVYSIIPRSNLPRFDESWMISLMVGLSFCLLWISFIPVLLRKFFFSRSYQWWQHLVYVWFTIILFAGVTWGVLRFWSKEAIPVSALFHFFYVIGGVLILSGIFIFLNYIFRKRMFVRKSTQLNDLLGQLIASSPVYRNEIHIHERGKSVLNTTSQDMLYIQGEGKFCYAYYLIGQDVRRKFIERRLEGLYQDLDSLPQIIRINEEYLINLHNISGFVGNAQGIFVELAGTELPAIVIQSKYSSNLTDRIRSFTRIL